MHSHALLFIQDLAIIMIVAGLTTIFFYRFKQPIVLGYILAGIIIGPYTPPFSFISDEQTIKTLAEVGVIFLMFSLGLEFNLGKLLKVGLPAFIAASFEIIIMIGLGYQIGRWFGYSQINALFLGAILSISSTTIIVKALDELKLKNEKFSQLIFGVLIVEDIVAILILALLSTIAISGSVQINEVVSTVMKLSSFLVVSVLLGIILLPRLLAYIAKFRNNEVLLISVLGMCFGFCLLVAKFEYSVALGAFLVGAMISESDQVEKIERLILPLRDTFSAIFFVSVGLMFDPAILHGALLPIMIITIAVVLGKVLSCSLGILVTGRDGKTALKVGMGLAQIGEFSFIIASLGITLGVIDKSLYSIAVSISIVTTLLTPYMIKHSDAVAGNLALVIPKAVSSTFTIYRLWVQNIRPEANELIIVQAIKKGIVQSVINLVIVMAVFLLSSYIAKSEAGGILTAITNIHMQKALIWSAAMITSMPFLIAVYRKVKAISMLLAELHVKEMVEERIGPRVRKVIAEMIPVVTVIFMTVYVILLSSAILPPIDFLLIAAVIIVIATILLYPLLVKLHSRLQIALMSVINK